MLGVPGKEASGSSERAPKSITTPLQKMKKEERKRENFTILNVYARLFKEIMRELIRKFNFQSSEKVMFLGNNSLRLKMAF